MGVRNKFVTLKEMIKDNVDIILVSEFKLDQTFPGSQFCIDGYSTHYHLEKIFPLK